MSGIRNLNLNLKIEEEAVIHELKRRTIQDCTPKMLEDPVLFYRFAKARCFNLKQAEDMLRKHISWRKEFNVDTITTDYKDVEVLKKYFPTNFLGFDKEGSIVRYMSIPETDFKGLWNATKLIDCMKFNVKFVEEDIEILHEQSKKLGKAVHNTIYIYNFNKMNFGMATHTQTLQLMMKWLQVYQDNYPERMKSLYCINASFYFTILFQALKHLAAPGVMEKVHLFGTDGWKESLLEIIDPDTLPAFLGGTKTDPDGNPLCKSFINHGGIVPERYYMQKSKKILYKEEGVKKLSVSRFSSFNIPFEVIEPGSRIEWEFETKCRDIAFALYFKEKFPTDSKLIELVPKQRVETDIEPETGMYKCDKPGLYVLLFDNSYSWIFNKEIFYRAKIVTPSQENDILNAIRDI